MRLCLLVRLLAPIGLSAVLAVPMGQAQIVGTLGGVGIDVQTGQVYPSVGGGFINPQSGAFYPAVPAPRRVAPVQVEEAYVPPPPRTKSRNRVPLREFVDQYGRHWLDMGDGYINKATGQYVPNSQP